MKSLNIVILMIFLSSCSSTSSMPRNTNESPAAPAKATTQTSPAQTATVQSTPVAANTTADDGIVSSTTIMRSIESQKSQSIATRSLGSNSFVGGKKAEGLNLQAIQFEYNSASITDKGQKQIDELAGAIKQYKNDQFEIIGHTDASGSDEYNLSLSKRRAAAVVNELKTRHGIDTSRLKSVGKGEQAPLDKKNPTSADNRRVEILYVLK